MIPAAHITAWAAHAPWPNDSDIEQDLILSRVMVEIALHELLGPELALRGGTCLHKLHLSEPLRYSEDLDYVRSTEGGIGPYLDALRELVTGIGLEEHGREFSEQMVHMIFDTDATDGSRRIRIKIETNTREIKPCFDRVSHPYEVTSPWWSGKARLRTFELAELMGTKLRALYQRRKGRDLFDLWHVLAAADVDDARVIKAYYHYIGDDEFTFPELARNLDAKLDDAGFRADLNDLVTEPPSEYKLEEAADLVMERLGSRLKNAPPLDEIRGGAWRGPH
jgi:predicted nucleotidyltransferase component of viral defense system